MATWIASPTGTPDGDGSIDSPWDLQTALNKTDSVDPGDTLYLRCGTYTGGFESTLLGEEGNNIVVRPYPGERVIWDGYQETLPASSVLLQQAGGYVTYRDFEFLNSDPVRTLAESGSNPATRRSNGPSFRAPGIKLINCLVHDLSEGPGCSAAAEGLEITGCVIWNNGWTAPDDPHGHAMYVQGGPAERVFKENVVVNSFAYGFHAYGSDAASLANLSFRNNMSLFDGLIGGSCPVTTLVFDGNYAFAPITIGYANQSNDGISLTNNKFVVRTPGTGALNIKYVLDNGLIVTGNTFHGDGNVAAIAIGITAPTGGTYAYTIDSNAYWRINSGYVWWKPGVSFTWTTWQEAGYDAAGSYTNVVTPASEDYADLRISPYDTGRANLVVTNFGSADSRSVDLSSFASVGDYIRVRNAQDYSGDVAYIKYTGDAVSFDMRAASHSVALPNGYESALSTTSFPQYGVFVLEKYTPIQKARSAVPFIRRRRR